MPALVKQFFESELRAEIKASPPLDIHEACPMCEFRTFDDALHELRRREELKEKGILEL